MTAALPMGNQKITGMADPTVATDGATKNYVDTLVATFFSTGDIKPTLKNTPDSGWLMFDDGTFGSAGSGSSNSNSVNNLALFTLFYTNLTDAGAPLLTSGGGATTRAAQTNAATAWAANCRMSLPKMLGRALGVAGSGSGLTARVLGTNLGEETHLLITAEIPAHSHINTLTDPGHTHPLSPSVALGNAGAPSGGPIFGGSTNITATGSATTGITINNVNAGGGGTHNNMQPTSFLNVMVKQ